MSRRRHLFRFASRRRWFKAMACGCLCLSLACLAAPYEESTSEDRPAPAATIGDLDGDNQVTEADVTRFQTLAASVSGFLGSKTGDAAYRSEADLDGDGEINWIDLQILINELSKE